MLARDCYVHPHPAAEAAQPGGIPLLLLRRYCCAVATARDAPEHQQNLVAERLLSSVPQLPARADARLPVPARSNNALGHSGGPLAMPSPADREPVTAFFAASAPHPDVTLRLENPAVGAGPRRTDLRLPPFGKLAPRANPTRRASRGAAALGQCPLVARSARFANHRGNSARAPRRDAFPTP